MYPIFLNPAVRIIFAEALCPLSCTRSADGRTVTRGACSSRGCCCSVSPASAQSLLGQGTDNSFSIPGTESQAGLEQLNRTFPQASGTSAQIIIVAADGAAIEGEPYSAAIADSIGELEDLDGVLAVTDPFDAIVNGLVSDDGDAAIVRLQFDGQATDVPPGTKTALAGRRCALARRAARRIAGGAGRRPVRHLGAGGHARPRRVGLLIALLVLIVTFRSFVVAGLPLLTAIIGVGLSMALIFLATAFATISSTTPLLALMLGLAVGIDYALFIVARHQDQVRAGVDPEESAARATGTAGSAVVFAGVTVLIALIGLSFAGIPFLTTMGIAAAVAVAIAVLVARHPHARVARFHEGPASAGRPPTRAARREMQRPRTPPRTRRRASRRAGSGLSRSTPSSRPSQSC